MSEALLSSKRANAVLATLVVFGPARERALGEIAVALGDGAGELAQRFGQALGAAQVVGVGRNLSGIVAARVDRHAARKVAVERTVERVQRAGVRLAVA
jgi:hypothetical protein